MKDETAVISCPQRTTRARIWIVFAVVSLLLPVSSAAEVVYKVLKNTEEETQKVQQEISQLEGKQRSLALEQQQADELGDRVDREARVFNDSIESQRLQDQVNNYKAMCPPGRLLVGDAEIARCDNALAAVKPILDQHNAKFALFKQQVEAQEAIVQQKKNELVLTRARITKLKIHLSWLNSAQHNLLSDLVAQCNGLSNTATIEEMKLKCGNVQFDGARANLAPCSTELCQSWIMYANQRTPEQAISDYRNSGAASPTRNPLLDKAKVPSPTNTRNPFLD